MQFAAFDHEANAVNAFRKRDNYDNDIFDVLTDNNNDDNDNDNDDNAAHNDYEENGKNINRRKKVKKGANVNVLNDK